MASCCTVVLPAWLRHFTDQSVFISNLGSHPYQRLRFFTVFAHMQNVGVACQCNLHKTKTKTYWLSVGIIVQICTTWQLSLVADSWNWGKHSNTAQTRNGVIAGVPYCRDLRHNSWSAPYCYSPQAGFFSLALPKRTGCTPGSEPLLRMHTADITA